MSTDDRSTLDAQEPDDTVDGIPVERLGDYLDAGRTPREPEIEGSAACRLYLQSLARVQNLSRASLEHVAAREPDRDGAWIDGLLDSIRREVVGGREIPVGHPDPGVRLSVTEAAARGLVRRAGDAQSGVVLGSTTIDGDLTTAGAPVNVSVTAAARYGLDLGAVADELRGRITETLTRHTGLNVTRVDVHIDDVFVPREDDR
ncbi:Asp23/Gls24 family envelope stress response protein [Frigoribacterium sp. VKM Ac-2836]|uniref:Asp23/Gls24 family envelope stress response protein n=1 Tax=Frigoribacterium sp. VKM Ac-2836 TaxID=2739014 RepID=UPI0015652F22|nr:Asp23/Gls24 family envelope stress response protein [Frigoribacterium sp. VKM Ac-2836]NRD27397.1 Asp23/Gls24 family envelope stress response protein [Frigoribacterium sp. VKM Ac-2836]